MAKRDCNVKTPTAKEEVVKNRLNSVGYLPNNGKPNPSPQLTISNKWLSELGFEVGRHYTLTRQVGQLIIWLAERCKRPDEIPALTGIFYLTQPKW